MNDIATLNDNFRKTFTGGQVLLSAGIVAMSSEDKANIISMVQNLNDTFRKIFTVVRCS